MQSRIVRNIKCGPQSGKVALCGSDIGSCEYRRSYRIAGVVCRCSGMVSGSYTGLDGGFMFGFLLTLLPHPCCDLPFIRSKPLRPGQPNVPFKELGREDGGRA